MATPAAITCVSAVLRWRGAIRHADTVYQLSDKGCGEAQAILRSHRLWEHYLVSEADLPAHPRQSRAARTLYRRRVATAAPSTAGVFLLDRSVALGHLRNSR